jgi:hypothetical protein
MELEQSYKDFQAAALCLMNKKGFWCSNEAALESWLV